MVKLSQYKAFSAFILNLHKGVCGTFPVKNAKVYLAYWR
jgi:hypothetical protein